MLAALSCVRRARVRHAAAQRAALQPRRRPVAAGRQCHRPGCRRLHVVRHRGRTQSLRRLRIPPAAPRPRRLEQHCRTAGSHRWSPSDDGLWIATDGGGVVFRNARTGQFDAPAGVARCADLQRVRALSRDSLGRLWIASRDAGVAIFDPRSGELTRLRHSATAAEFALRQLGVHHPAPAQRRQADRHGDRTRPHSGGSLDVRRVALPRGTRRRRASRCACARWSKRPTAWSGWAPTTVSVATIRAAIIGACIRQDDTRSHVAARQSRADAAHRQPGSPVGRH